MNLRADYEEAILGAILSESGAYLKICEILTPRNFKNPVYAEIYKVVAELFPSIELRAVNHRLGGNYAELLMVLTTKVCSTENLRYQARTIVEFDIREAFIKLLNEAKYNHPVTILSAIQDLINTANDDTKDILLTVKKARPYLNSICANDDLLKRVQDFEEKVYLKAKRFREQTTLEALIKQLENAGKIPQDEHTKEATQKLIELLKLAISFGFDKELSTKIIQLYDQRTKRL